MKYIIFISMNFLLLYWNNAYAATPEFCNSIATADINRCADHLLNRSDKKLNDKYKELLTSLQPNLKEILIRSQKSWISYRDTTCQIYQPDSEGKYSDGSYAGNEAYAEKKHCETDITESRVIEIKTILNGGTNHPYNKSRKYIARKFYQDDVKKLNQELINAARRNEHWVGYADESCKLNEFLFKEGTSSCLARLAFFDQPTTNN